MRETYSLREIAPGLACVDYERWEKALHFSLRMCIVDVGSGGLLLHSPVPIDDALAAQIEALGAVRYLVAPNLGHHLFVEAAHERYPAAQLCGAPGLGAKKPRLPIERELEDGARFGETLRAHCLRGSPALNEVTFYHQPSKSLICTDFIQNIVHEDHFLTRQLWRAIGVYKIAGQNRVWRRRVKDRGAALASVEAMLDWDFERVVMAHGAVIEEDARSLVIAATDWMR
ncbi:MAG: DUF4336 domain-containing protein [Haliangiales bacterium]